MNLLKQLGLSTENNSCSFSKNHWFGSADNTFDSINPDDAKSIAKINPGTLKDYHQIIREAKRAQKSWQCIPAPQRGELIRQIAIKLREYKSALGSLIALEMGKSKQEGEGEVQEMIDIADFAVGQSRMLYGKTMHSERPLHRMYEQWHPLGVVGVISAFNFPVAVWAWNAFIAAICGNTVLWKPSHKTPLCSIAVQHLCNEVMAENHLSGIFSLMITEDHQVADALVADIDIALLSFTGSTAVGQKVAAKVASRFGKSILELGGNNAVIIDKTADLNLAIPAVVFGAVGTAGQRCTTTRRVFVEKTIYKKVSEKLVHAYQQLKIGSPLDETNHMGPLIDEAAIDQYRTAIQSALDHGGECLVGGKVLQRPGYYVEPTIIKAANHWEIVQQETFAPILYLMAYDTLEEAIALQNQVKQGLSSALFTQNLLHAEKFLAATGSDCGIANVNIGTSGAEIGGAFGGEKQTGGGREAGSDAWKAYMRRQTNTINFGDSLPLAQGIKFDLNS